MTLVAGIDVGGTKILGRVFDPDDPAVAVATVRRDTPHGAPAIVDALAEVVEQLARAAPGPDGLAAIGVGAAGLVDLRGVLHIGPNLPSVIEADLAGDLGARLGRPVVVENDATAATYGELRCGVAVGVEEVVLVTLGTGIGGGLVIGGELRRGAAGFAGEPGHMVVDPSGPPCPCGRSGCWERFASGSGLGRLGRDAAEAGQAARVVALAGGDPQGVRGEHVSAAALEGDPDALEVLRQFAWWVALGLANLIDVLDPELVVIGGGLVEVGDALLVPVREAFRGLVLAPGHRPPVRIEPAALGAAAGAIGAGLLAAHALR